MVVEKGRKRIVNGIVNACDEVVTKFGVERERSNILGGQSAPQPMCGIAKLRANHECWEPLSY
jgi:hypothetical protein